MIEWRQFVMNLESLHPDSVEAILLRHGAHSVTLTDAGDMPVLEPGPGATPLWQQTRITGLFDADLDIRALERDLKASLRIDELPARHVEALSDRDWEREWLKDFGPMRFGERLWVCPGDAEIDQASAIVVRLDPGLAFGTGTHATTAMCLEWLDGLALDRRTVLDYGCGSGVLAIAALKLGAARAVGTDIDPQALTASRQNARRNGVDQLLELVADVDDIGGSFDVVVANILAGPLVERAVDIAGLVREGGVLALSGILAGQAAAVRKAYARWIDFEAPVARRQDGQTWIRLTGTRSC